MSGKDGAWCTIDVYIHNTCRIRCCSRPVPITLIRMPRVARGAFDVHTYITHIYTYTHRKTNTSIQACSSLLAPAPARAQPTSYSLLFAPSPASPRGCDAGWTSAAQTCSATPAGFTCGTCGRRTAAEGGWRTAEDGARERRTGAWRKARISNRRARHEDRRPRALAPAPTGLNRPRRGAARRVRPAATRHARARQAGGRGGKGRRGGEDLRGGRLPR